MPTVSISSSLSPGTQVPSSSSSKTITTTGYGGIAERRSASTSWAAISWGTLSGTPRRVRIVNVGTSNFLELALANDGSQKFAKVRAGEDATFEPSTGTIYIKADTAAVAYLIVAVEA